MTGEKTGIAFFVYDRPEHTRQVLDGLRANDVDHFYVFSDGPATEDEADDVREVRALVENVGWATVDLITREENWGLRKSILAGYEYVLDRHDRIIYIEDDCVPASDFIQFMERCLDEYDGDDRVMNVHGYTPPISIPDDYEYDIFFTHRSGSWGQATWRDAWDHYDRDPALLEETIGTEAGRRKLERAGPDLESMLRDDLNGDVTSVQAWWSLALVRNGGLSVNPVRSRIRNIGHDGTGTHSVTTTRFDVSLSTDRTADEMRFPDDPFVDSSSHRCPDTPSRLHRARGTSSLHVR